MALFNLLQAAAPAPAQGGQSAPGGSGIESIVLMVGVMLILYFFMIRPQVQKQKKEKQFRNSLKAGDKVVTIGGVHGKIAEIDSETVLLVVDEGVKLRFERNAIARAVVPEAEGAKK
jgi:preprotein translocase subunit YajC